MSLLDTLRNALGLQKPLALRDPDAVLALSPAARERLLSLPPGHGIHVSTVPTDHGDHRVQVEEGPSQGPPPPGFDDLPLTSGNLDLERLRGLTLDWRDGRWALSCPLDIRARETPNPDGRLYLTDRVLAVGRALFFSREATDLPRLPAVLLESPHIHSVLLRENTLTVERTDGVGWPVVDRHVDAAVRTWLLGCGRPLSTDDLPERDDPFEEAIVQVLQERIAPGVQRDGGQIELVSVKDGVVYVSMQGACRTCPASTATLRFGVERTLKEAFPDRIVRVEAV